MVLSFGCLIINLCISFCFYFLFFIRDFQSSSSSIEPYPTSSWSVARLYGQDYFTGQNLISSNLELVYDRLLGTQTNMPKGPVLLERVKFKP